MGELLFFLYFLQGHIAKMKEEVRKIYLEVIEESTRKDTNRGRKSAHDNGYYLDRIIEVFDSDMKWKYLKCDVHYTTVYKVFRKWSKLQVFQCVHSKIIKLIFGDQLSVRNTNINKNDKQIERKLYIDSTDIINKAAYESVGYTFKYKNKKATRITIIADDRNIPLAADIVNASIPDSKLVQETLKCVPIELKNTKQNPIYLIADKGYINERVKKLIKRKVTLVYPYRSTQKKTNTAKEKELQKGRYKIENLNSWFKNNKRLSIRVDRIDETFKSFIYLRFIQIIELRISRLEININGIN
jgi:transposase